MTEAQTLPGRTSLARAFARHGVTRCAIMATTFRTGSTWIGRVMDRHGLIGMKHERLRGFRDAADLDGMLRVVPQVFATRLMWVQCDRLARGLGFARDDHAGLAAQFPDAAWLYLRRRDVVAQAISYWRAKATGRWHGTLTDTASEPAIAYDFAAIDGCARELVEHDRQWENFFASAGIVPQTVWYEDVLHDWAAIARFMARFGHDLPETDSEMKVLGDAHSARLADRYCHDVLTRTPVLDAAVR